MNWRSILPVLCVAIPPALACALVALPRDPEASAEILSADGYARVVNDVFVANDYLRTPSGADQPVVDFGPAWANLDEDGREARVLRRFVRESALGADLARNDPELWRIDRGLAGMALGAHDRVSPFAQGRWRGALRIADSAHRATLTLIGDPSSGLAIGLVGGDIAATRDGEAEVLRIPLYDPPSAARDATVVELTAGPTDPDYLARVMMLGSTALVVAGQRPDVVRLDGSPEALRPGEAARLLSGSTLSLQLAGRAPVTLRLDSGVAAFSVAGALGGRRRHPEYEDFAKHFDSAMDIAVMACERRRGDCAELAGRDVTLTLDVGLERNIRRELQGALGDSLYPGAVTVIDALNGDVLAAVGHDPATAWRDEDLFGDRPRPVNYAFEPLTIGSAAKPPVAAAILSHHARRRSALGDASLLDLQIRNTAASELCDDEIALYARDLLGVPLGRTCGQWIRTGGGGDWINLTRFLEVSSNQYAASLMVLGTSIDVQDESGQASSGWRLGDAGAERTRLPRLAEGVLYPGDQPAFGKLNNQPRWSPQFTTLFPVGDRDAGAGLSDLGVWRDILGAVSERDRARLTPLSAISPSILSFDFEELHVRQDYLPIILGGQAFRWSTLRLAESYARLTTGDDVRARLTRIGGGRAGRLNAYPDPVRGAVCRGLVAVMEGENGTGRSDAGPMGVVRQWRTRTGDSIVVYGKTGTPEIETYSADQLRYIRDQDRLLTEGFITYRAGLMVVPDGAGGYVAPGDSAASAHAVRLLQALAGAQERIGPVAVRLAVERMEDFNTAAPDRRGNYYSFRDGRPQAIVPPDPDDRMFGHVIVFVVAVYAGPAPQTCVEAQPVRAFAIAVNVQDEQHSALTLASRVLAHLEPRVLGGGRPS